MTFAKYVRYMPRRVTPDQEERMTIAKKISVPDAVAATGATPVLNWEAATSSSLEENHKLFTIFLRHAQKSFVRGRYETAALYAELAAYCATWKHAGFFASRSLEDLLLAIGGKNADGGPTREVKDKLESIPARILHVATWVEGLQGLNRLLWRWMQVDNSRVHSVVVTGHDLQRVPGPLKDAVLKSKGTIQALDESTGGVLARARRLRSVAALADLVVLHLQTEDILPLIAFADGRGLGPVLFVNNADHNFWLGASVSDLVVNLRESGQRLSIDRRGTTSDRNVLLPILLDRRWRTQDRNEAKRKLGLNPDSVLLLSVARWPKYQPFGGVSYPQSHLPVLMQHREAVLWVIGPHQDKEWRRAGEHTGGRVKAFGPRADTTPFYEAADVYVDSFPIVSITSLLEAGSYGVPLLSRYPYSDKCGILGADTPALAKCITRARTLDEYHSLLSRFIERKELREELGARAKKAIEETHYPENWLPVLESVYARACDGSRRAARPLLPDECCQGEPDIYIPEVYRMGERIEQVLVHYIGRFPLDERARLLMQFAPSLPYVWFRRLVGRNLRRLSDLIRECKG
jgi:hypothetical protein